MKNKNPFDALLNGLSLAARSSKTCLVSSVTRRTSTADSEGSWNPFSCVKRKEAQVDNDRNGQSQLESLIIQVF